MKSLKFLLQNFFFRRGAVRGNEEWGSRRSVKRESRLGEIREQGSWGVRRNWEKRS